jgi:hypothetical protein
VTLTCFADTGHDAQRSRHCTAALVIWSGYLGYALLIYHLELLQRTLQPKHNIGTGPLHTHHQFLTNKLLVAPRSLRILDALVQLLSHGILD